MLPYIATFTIGLIGGAAGAIAEGETWRVAISFGLCVACSSLTCHRLMKGSEG